jgi:hypothetical protein
MQEQSEPDPSAPAPFWSDDFDMDLPRIVPGWLDILGETASVALKTHSHTTMGRINLPSCWNEEIGLVSYLGFESPCKPDWYYTAEPVVECTFAEAVRDCWAHSTIMRIDGSSLIRGDMMREVFDPIMYHRRGWFPCHPARVKELEGRATAWVRYCAETMRELLALREGQDG